MQINPSQVTDEYWVFAERTQGTYPPHSKNGGKWLISIPIGRIDQAWSKIKLATEAGRLGEMSKVATAKDNFNATNSGTKVICVYTYDWTDEVDVMRIRQELRQLGITRKIPPNSQTSRNIPETSPNIHLQLQIFFTRIRTLFKTSLRNERYGPDQFKRRIQNLSQWI